MDEPQDNQQPEMIEKDIYLRLAADFDNYRRQQTQAAAEMAKWSAQKVITDMLDLIDLLDSALAHAPPQAKEQIAWYSGLVQVGKQFLEKMKQYGVERVQAVGIPFDPVTMEAVSMVQGGEPNTVKEEVRAGYAMHGRSIRPARVIVYQ
jgi:molecular chaperone GrpE